MKHLYDKRTLTCEIHGPSTPGATGREKYTTKPKNLLSSQTCEEKTGCKVMISMKPSTKIVKFMAPGSGVQVLGWGQYGHIIKMY